MRGGTRGAGRGLSRNVVERRNYGSDDYEERDDDSIVLSQFDDIDGANVPVRRVRAREPPQHSQAQSDYDSQRKVFEHIRSNGLMLFISSLLQYSEYYFIIIRTYYITIRIILLYYIPHFFSQNQIKKSTEENF